MDNNLINNLQNELKNLEEWFTYVYSEQNEKTLRKIELGKTMSDGKDARQFRQELLHEAEQKSQRVRELRSLLSNI